jgi:hypothetical protein
VVDDADALEDIVAEHRAELVVGVRAMGAGRHEEDHVFQTNETVELLEEGGDDDMARLGSRAVADRDRDGPAAFGDVTERRPGDRAAQSREHLHSLVLGCLRMAGSDHRRPALWKLDGESRGSVRELDSHRLPTIARGVPPNPSSTSSHSRVVV